MHLFVTSFSLLQFVRKFRLACAHDVMMSCHSTNFQESSGDDVGD